MSFNVIHRAQNAVDEPCINETRWGSTSTLKKGELSDLSVKEKVRGRFLEEKIKIS